MKKVEVLSAASILGALFVADSARAQVSVGVGVGRPGVSVYTPYFSFQYARPYPPYVYRPFSYYDVPFYGNWYGAYRLYPPVFFDRGPAFYGWGNTPNVPNDFMSQPRFQPYQSGYMNPSDTSANISVLVPNPNAKVWFDDTLMKQQGTDRQYTTPALDKEKTYSYKIRASWIANGREVTREKTVSVAPGQDLVVNFTDDTN